MLGALSSPPLAGRLLPSHLSHLQDPEASQCHHTSPGGQLWAAFLVTPSSRNVPASVKSGLAPERGAARLLLIQPALLFPA